MSKKKKTHDKKDIKTEAKENKPVLFCIFIFIFTFIIYLLTAFPSLSPIGDGAELVTNSYLLGINHPPGYPLYSMMGYIFTLFPAGPIPFRINLMSAFFSSLAAVFIFLSAYILYKNKIPALISSLIFAFSYTFWKISTCAEVFSFNVFWGALLIFLIILWREKTLKKENPTKILYLFSLMAGLSLCHHHTILFLFPGFLCISIITDKKLFTDRRVIISLVLFLSALLLYVYLPLRASSAPMNWGATDLDGTLKVIGRKGYGSLSLGADVAGWSIQRYLNNISIYLISLFWQFTPLILPLLFIGIYRSVKKDKTIFVFLILLFIFSGPIFLAIANPATDEGWKWIIERFYVISFMSLTFFIGFGLDFLWSLGKKTKIIYLTLLLALIPLIYNFSSVNNRNNYVYYDYATNLLASLPENAIFISTTDLSGMAVLYLQNVEGLRPDIKAFQYGLMGSPWYIKEQKKKFSDLFTMKKTLKKEETIKHLIENGFPHVYIDLPVDDFAENLICNGLTYKFEESNIPDQENTKHIFKKLENDLKTRNNLNENLYNGFFTKEILKFYAVAYYSLGKDFQFNNLFSEAKDAYEKSLKIYELSAVYSALGLIYRQEGDLTSAEKYFKKALEKDRENSDAYFNLGIVYLLQEDHKKSEQYFKESQNLSPDNPLIYSNMAILYDKQGDSDEAVKSLEKALSLDPENPDICYNLAIMMIKENRLMEAEKYLKKALQMGYSEAEINQMLLFIQNK